MALDALASFVFTRFSGFDIPAARAERWYVEHWLSDARILPDCWIVLDM